MVFLRKISIWKNYPSIKFFYYKRS